MRCGVFIWGSKALGDVTGFATANSRRQGIGKVRDWEWRPPL